MANKIRLGKGEEHEHALCGVFAPTNSVGCDELRRAAERITEIHVLYKELFWPVLAIFL